MERKQIEVPISKTKLAFVILGCLLFVALGAFMLLNATEMQTRKFSPVWLMGFGGIAIIFFGGICISAIKKIVDKRPGLRIDEKGIMDNSSGVSPGLVVWEHIIGIRKIKVSGTRFLLIDVRNPEKYIQDTKKRIKRQVMKANAKKYGTPISISSNGLSITFKKLEELIVSAFETYKK